MCNKCGHKETTETRCAKCDSWNLTPLGIGTDRVYEEVQKLFPKSTIIQINREATSTDKEAREAIKLFSKTSGSILIGTEMAFSYLETEVTHSAIISLDGLLSIPNFNMSQKILHIIEKLHCVTDRNLIIQTRIPENKTLQYILSGNVLPLYREDLKERKIFGYPPFKRLIKITFTGTKEDTEKARAYIDKTLDPYDPQIFSAFIGKVKGQYITNTVIKLDPELWSLSGNQGEKSHEYLSEVLSHLPPSFAINIDPEDLL
jgi:primosomal protein N' (replication factor Y)